MIEMVPQCRSSKMKIQSLHLPGISSIKVLEKYKKKTTSTFMFSGTHVIDKNMIRSQLFLYLYILVKCFTFWKPVFTQEVEFYPGKQLHVSLTKDLSSRIQKKSNYPDTHINMNKVTQSTNTHVIWREFDNDNGPIKGIQGKKIHKRSADPVFHGHPKTQEELWFEYFLNKSTAFDQTPSLIKLIHNVTLTYLTECTPVILYNSQIKSKESYILQNLLKGFPVSYIHGYIDENNRLKEPKLLTSAHQCLDYIVFLEDVRMGAKVLGKQSESKVVIVARSSQWAVQEFLSSPLSRMFIHLLVIGQSFKDEDDTLEAPYILYTHRLYTDGLGASKPQVLTSWTHGKFSREVNLFPPKMSRGYAGHRFLIAAANQPPFVFRRIHTDLDGGNPRVVWDGIEIRLLKLLAERNNFSIEIVEPRSLELGPGDAVVKEIIMGRADIGVAGMYVTSERAMDMDMSFAHSQDCAVFITLMSTALPRYRAILGPFHWHVWVALTFTYLVGIFPLAFSDKHSLRHLLNNSGEIENMFWYVFGTFTNCFTFVGKNSWSKTTKITTRLLIGWYWLFTIIITSCYTGSIIAFVTLPIFPETVDSIYQLLGGFYRVGTLDRGGWERWFFNSSDINTNKLLKKIEFVPNVQAGIRNTTKAFFWPYAFLGSRAEFEYIVQTNFTLTKSKRSLLHISNECFVPFGVTMAFPNNSVYTAKLSNDIRRMLQGGILDKIVDEVRWEMQRSSTRGYLSIYSYYHIIFKEHGARLVQGTLHVNYLPKDFFYGLGRGWVITCLGDVGKGSLKISSIEEKGLTLEDTQGMFLLLGAGFLLAAVALLSEWMGGFTKQCKKMRRRFSTSGISREDLMQTPQSDTLATVFDATESVLNFESGPYSAASVDTLEGQVINVTEKDIIVHKDYDIHDPNSRRSSSIDLNREIKEIFERDEERRKFGMEGDICEEIGDREKTASKGAFGDPVPDPVGSS